jgi:hypothetical protein
MREGKMPRESLLLGLAEVSVALTGFSGIVVFLGRRASGEWTEADRTRVWSMISSGLLALLLSLSPFLFWELSSNPDITWAASSGLGAVAGVIALTAGLRQSIRTAAADDTEANFLAGYLLVGITALILLALALNAIGIGLARSFTPYLIALLWYLTLASLLFLRLLRFW